MLGVAAFFPLHVLLLQHHQYQAHHKHVAISEVFIAACQYLVQNVNTLC